MTTIRPNINYNITHSRLLSGATDMKNRDRAFVEIINSYAADRKIAVSALSSDWIFVFKKEDFNHCVFGYDLGLNPSSSLQIANDKSATSQVLCISNVSNIEHRLFMAPSLPDYVDQGGNWQAITNYYNLNNCDVVCKPNAGTGGIGVYRANSIIDLEYAVHKLFQSSRSICLSPFITIKGEYRCIILDDECPAIFEKVRPHLIGDGISTIRELIIRSHAVGEIPDVKPDKLNAVLRNGEIFDLEWRHNLAHGATANLLSTDDTRWKEIELIANAARMALGIRFASIDIVETDDGLAVLEVNAGVMMEKFARQSPETWAIAKSIYYNALDKALLKNVS